jgi:signal transduction histidine kinase
MQATLSNTVLNHDLPDRSAASFFASLSAAVGDLVTRNPSEMTPAQLRRRSRANPGAHPEPSLSVSDASLLPRMRGVANDVDAPGPADRPRMSGEARVRREVSAAAAERAKQYREEQSRQEEKRSEEQPRKRTRLEAMAPLASSGMEDLAEREHDGFPTALVGEETREAAEAPEATGGAGLAHDASNLLSALTLYSELLAFPDVLAERHRHYASDLKLLADRSWTLIDRLLTFGGMAEVSTEAAGRTASVVDTLMECEGLLATLAQGRLEVTFGSQAALPIRMASESLERILVNLVKNAAQATKDGGSIRIRVGVPEQGGPRLVENQKAPTRTGSGPRLGARRETRRIGLEQAGSKQAESKQAGQAGAKGESEDAPRLVLTVDDSGRGMTEAQVQAVMHAGAPVPGQQHGVGLRVVRELVAASGGRLTVHSRAGVGTRIEIEWPTAIAGVVERIASVDARQGKLTENNLAAHKDILERQILGCFASGGVPEEGVLAGGLTEAERQLLIRQIRPGDRRGTGESPGGHFGELLGEAPVWEPSGSDWSDGFQTQFDKEGNMDDGLDGVLDGTTDCKGAIAC